MSNNTPGDRPGKDNSQQPVQKSTPSKREQTEVMNEDHVKQREKLSEKQPQQKTR